VLWQPARQSGTQAWPLCLQPSPFPILSCCVHHASIQLPLGAAHSWLLCRVLVDVERPAPGGLTFRVLPPMPRLEVSVAGLPPTMLAGEVVRCSMRLTNSGAMTLQRLSMATASSAGLFLGSPSSGNNVADAGAATAAAAIGSLTVAEQPGSNGTSRSQATELTANFHLGGAGAVFTLPSARLGAGQELTLPVWFRWGATHCFPDMFCCCGWKLS
jgi:hypothetical protein